MKPEDAPVINFLREADFPIDACKMTMSELGLRSKNSEEIYLLMKFSGFNENFCLTLLSKITSDKKMKKMIPHVFGCMKEIAFGKQYCRDKIEEFQDS